MSDSRWRLTLEIDGEDHAGESLRVERAIERCHDPGLIMGEEIARDMAHLLKSAGDFCVRGLGNPSQSFENAIAERD